MGSTSNVWIRLSPMYSSCTPDQLIAVSKSLRKWRKVLLADS
jgi:hypothetical protein